MNIWKKMGAAVLAAALMATTAVTASAAFIAGDVRDDKYILQVDAIQPSNALAENEKVTCKLEFRTKLENAGVPYTWCEYALLFETTVVNGEVDMHCFVLFDLTGGRIEELEGDYRVRDNGEISLQAWFPADNEYIARMKEYNEVLIEVVGESNGKNTYYFYDGTANEEYSTMTARVQWLDLENNSDDADASDDSSAPDDTTTTTTPSTPDNSDKDNPDTGSEGIALTLGMAALAGAAVVIYRKRK